MPKLIMMPPQNAELQDWAHRIHTELPIYDLVLPETDNQVSQYLPDADAVYGWVSPEQLPLAAKICVGYRVPPPVPPPASTTRR